jgi:uncharacterized damage-inducible protein DinB
MITEIIRSIYQYNGWANTRILDTAVVLSPEQLQAPRGASFESIHKTLVHIMSAQRMWLTRWKGTSLRAVLDVRQFPDLAAIRTAWQKVEWDTREFVANLKESDFAHVVQYTNAEGQTWGYPLWQQMFHQVNHATQHRSEVAFILTEFGHSPGALDLLYFVDVQAAEK